MSGRRGGRVSNGLPQRMERRRALPGRSYLSWLPFFPGEDGGVGWAQLIERQSICCKWFGLVHARRPGHAIAALAVLLTNLT